MVDRRHGHLEPEDVWWVLFRDKDRSLTNGSSRFATSLFGKPEHPCIELDQATTGRLAGQHFLDRGYRNIAVIDNKPKDEWTQRREALREFCSKNRMNFASQIHQDPDQISELTDWLRDCPQPLGVYAYTDDHATWIRSLCLNAGLRVPDQIAILGTGDTPRICLNGEPTLSSIALPWRQIGEAAGRHVHHLVSSGEHPPPQRLSPLLVTCRDSTADRFIEDPVVRKAHQWLKTHLGSAKPLAEAARFCGCSIQTLCTHFKAELGDSPKQTHDRMRCNRMVELLSDPHMKLTQIAKKTGFSSVTAMGVAFKRRFGCSATQWRERMG